MVHCILNKTLAVFVTDNWRELGTYHEANAIAFTRVTYLFYPNLTAGCLPYQAHNLPTSRLQFRLALT